MKSMANRQQYLVRHPRSQNYYFRQRVPKDIKATFGKTEVTFSLGTSNRDEAISLAKLKAVEVDQLFDEHRREVGLTKKGKPSGDVAPNTLSTAIL
jgi:hypothetical protein